jgi:hypothetical protein
MGLDLASTHTVVTKAKDGHYQIACTKLFELTRGKVHAEADRKAKDGAREGGGLVGNNEFSIDSEGNFMLLEPIESHVYNCIVQFISYSWCFLLHFLQLPFHFKIEVFPFIYKLTVVFQF